MARLHSMFLPLALGLATLVMAGPALATADGPDFYRVVGVAPYDVLNMRAGPAVSYAVVHRIPPDGRGIENLASCVGNWCQVRFDGVIGWVNRRYLAEDGYDGPPVRVHRVVGVAYNDVLNVRAGPSAKHTIVGVIPYDGVDVIMLGECHGKWCRVRYDDTYGWVHTRYLAPY